MAAWDELPFDVGNAWERSCGCATISWWRLAGKQIANAWAKLTANTWDRLPGSGASAWSRLCAGAGNAWSKLPSSIGNAYQRLCCVCEVIEYNFMRQLLWILAKEHDRWWIAKETRR